MPSLWGALSMAIEQPPTNIIRSSDFTGISAPGAQSQGGGFNFSMKDIKDMIDFAKEIINSVVQIQKAKMQMQQSMNPPQQLSQARPEAIDTNKDSRVQVQEKIIYQNMEELDPKKIENALRELIEITLPAKLPEEYKSRPLSDFIGENVKKLEIKVKYMGMNITADYETIIPKLSEYIAKNLAMFKKD